MLAKALRGLQARTAGRDAKRPGEYYCLNSLHGTMPLWWQDTQVIPGKQILKSHNF